MLTDGVNHPATNGQSMPARQDNVLPTAIISPAYNGAISK